MKRFDPTKNWKRLRGLALGVMLFAATPAGADCGCGLLVDVAAARSCLDSATLFASNVGTAISDEGASGSFTRDLGTSESAVLDLAHESPTFSRECVDAVIAFASNSARIAGEEAGELLFDAAFLGASAHGMLGDDQLVRGLHYAFDPSQAVLSHPHDEAVRHLDSRVCAPSDTSHPLSVGDVLCETDADCTAGTVCTAVPTSNGLTGAVQEYRAGEGLLVDALGDLGPDRFRSYDLAATQTCQGQGCSARLLVRLGALRTQAQAERLELQWSRALASGITAGSELACSAGVTGAACQLDRDCDTPSPGAGDGICGSLQEEKERQLVRVRTAANQAAAEAAMALSLYRVAAPSVLEAASSDLALLRNALAEIEELVARSVTGATPFALPADYIPFLSDHQRTLLGCSDVVSTWSCLLALLEGDAPGAPSIPGALDELENAAGQSQPNLNAYAQMVRDLAAGQLDHEQGYVDILTRMFGVEEPGGAACDATAEAAGECLTFGNPERVWIVEGMACDDPETSTCATEGADGAIERQIQAIHAADVALVDMRRLFEDHLDQVRFTSQSYLELVAIETQRCESVRVTVEAFGRETEQAIEDRITELTNRNDTRKERLDQAINDAGRSRSPWGAAFGPSGTLGPFFGMTGWGKTSADYEREEDLRLQIKLDEIERAERIEVAAIECDATVQRLENQESNALRALMTRGLELEVEANRKVAARQEAISVLQQLVAETARARQRYDELEAFQAVWQQNDFRNPQNYRMLALESQLEASYELQRARLLTWMLLRSTAYDLAEPDFVAPERELRSGQTIEIAQCTRYACSDDGSSCIDHSDCAGGTCESGEDADVAVDGSCSLQAVFAARDAASLRSLIASAWNQLYPPYRPSACTDGCDKSLSLRSIFTTQATPLGGVLATLPLDGSNEAALDFGITLERGFDICPLVSPNGPEQCLASGVGGLLGDASGTGDDAHDFWNARLLTFQADVTYQWNRDPAALLCRSPDTLEPVGHPGLCFNRAVGDVCGVGGCIDANGQPVDCTCNRVLRENSTPQFDLVQAGPGLVRSRLAAKMATGGRDTQLSYRIRVGDLPNGSGQRAAQKLGSLLGEFSPFRLQDVVSGDVPDDRGLGVPLASPNWQLRFKWKQCKDQSESGQSRCMRELLRSIDDVTLHFTYDAYGLDEVSTQ
jgi:hypothetical protein